MPASVPILEVLADKGELRFARLGDLVEGIGQKMLARTLRQMERDGLLTRKVYPVVPPNVCGAWVWVSENWSTSIALQ